MTELTIVKKRLPEPRNESASALLSSIDRFASHFRAGGNFSFEAWAAACMVELNKIDKPVTIASALMACLHSARLSLIPGPEMGLIFFVPFQAKGNKAQVSVVVGYRGLLELSYANNFLASVQCGVVLDGEPFEFGFDSTKGGAYIKHEIDVNDRLISWERLTASYCLAQPKAGGPPLVTVVSKPELAKVRKSFGPWKEYPGAMAQKTAIIRASRTWPKLSPAMATAVHLDTQYEIGQEQEIDLPEDIAGHRDAGDLAEEIGMIAACTSHGQLQELMDSFSVRDDLDDKKFQQLENYFEKQKAHIGK